MRRAILAAAIYLASAFGAMAQSSNAVVVELFTSQGCSSCPPADAFLHKLAKRDDVIALGFHVDIWDYIGWKDRFAKREYTERQRSYARAAGARSIYTPQMIIGGVDHVIGYNPMETMDLVAKHKAKGYDVALELTRSGDRVTVEASAEKPSQMVVQVAQISPNNQTKIKRGENAGRTISYANVVTDFDVLKKWNGRGKFKSSFEAEGDMPVVVIVQRAGHEEILAAAKIN
ncbi:MAG: DUF1223 domain-containing protein [Pseudomonadota bacterium]